MTPEARPIRFRNDCANSYGENKVDTIKNRNCYMVELQYYDIKIL